ncbi:MAG: substrate-binding domain-containing protein, partial [Pseudomonadota bacterium]|nr:substrate-binding domain-containing protein [Pseudomonadota bacterium]
EYPEDIPAPSVTVDNAGGAEKAVRHLAELGHAKIGHITGPRGNILTTTRLQGFRAGLKAMGLTVHEDYILPGDFNLEAGKLAAEIWRTMKDRPTAMFCASDQQAFGFISQLSRQGFSVPEDVSVIGFDDIEVSGFFVPALTTISQPRLELGRMAARMLLDRINGQSHREGLHPQLDVTLVVRDSTAAPQTE